MIQDADLEAALKCAPEVRAPRNFRQRVMAALPEAVPEQRASGWRLPLFALAMSLGLAALMTVALWSGVAGWLAQPVVLWSLLAIETVVAGGWFLRRVLG